MSASLVSGHPSWGVHTPDSALPRPRTTQPLLPKGLRKVWLLHATHSCPSRMDRPEGRGPVQSIPWAAGLPAKTSGPGASGPAFRCPLASHLRPCLRGAARLQEEPEVAACSGHPVAGHRACDWGAGATGQLGCGPGPLHFSGKGDLGPGFFRARVWWAWQDLHRELGPRPRRWGCAGPRPPHPSGDPPAAGQPASPLATWVRVRAGGTAPGVPTHGHQHVPLEGVRELPPDEHLQADGGAGPCPEPRPPSASLSTAWAPTAARLQPPRTGDRTAPAGHSGETGR